MRRTAPWRDDDGSINTQSAEFSKTDLHRQVCVAPYPIRPGDNCHASGPGRVGRHPGAKVIPSADYIQNAGRNECSRRLEVP
jgi:hypothetical protein